MQRRPAAALLAAASAAVAADPAQLEQKYGALLNETCAEVLAHIPTLPADDAGNFMRAYQAFNGTGDEAPVLHFADVLLSRPDVQKFLSLPDSFVPPGGLDAAMARCAVLSEATPEGLARFAANATGGEGLIDGLLNDALLMRDMLLAGGARGGKDGMREYGEAMSIYTRLLQASEVLSSRGGGSDAAGFWDDRSQNKTAILRRLALGTAVEHAVPIPLRWPSGTNADPVARYLHYERAYLAGDLDPAFEALTAFEYRHVADSDASNDDLAWMRRTMANYRPDNIAKGHPWRYAQAVHSDVAYGHPACADMPGICGGSYAQIPAAGGECGPRAFFGRVTREAFGLPTWGVTQPGHAAMSTWAPDGWHVLLGAGWEFSYWAHRSPARGGPDFFLETQCRELRPAYQKVLRGGWAAAARGEEPVDPQWTPHTNRNYGAGGLWSALTLYQKKLAVAAATAGGAALPARRVGAPVVPTKVGALLARWNATHPPPNVTSAADGTVTVPAAAYTIKNRSASLAVMPGFASGEQLLHSGGDYVDPDSSAFGYEVTADEAGKYFLTANISTWHVNQDLAVSTNTSGKPQAVPVYYTAGYWNETQPIEVSLLKGRNVLTFTRQSDREVAFKEFFLFKQKPVVPPPPSNYTPAPTEANHAYIAVSAATTCTKQGITTVPNALDCSRACTQLGFNTSATVNGQHWPYEYHGHGPNMTGCFVMAAGMYKGTCAFNTNASAFCADPPCTVSGAPDGPHIAQLLCIRK